jgi:hypothetical protein
MRIARRVASDVRVGLDADADADNDDRGRELDEKRRRDRQQPAVCGCGRRLRMAPSVLGQGPVLCGICGEQFAIGKTVASSVARGSVAENVGGGDVVESVADYRRLSSVQREGVATLAEIGATDDGALLLAEVGAWYAARKQGCERPLAVPVVSDIDAANRAARAMLKLDGTLRDHAAIVSGREVMIGDLVVVTPTANHVLDVDGVELPPPGVFGTIVGASHRRAEITIDFAICGRRTLAVDAPAAAAIAYGYAEEGHETLLADTPRLSPRAELAHPPRVDELLP